MPLFDYKCLSCEHIFEKVVKMGDESPQVCPKCGGQASQTLSAPAPFQWGGGRPWNQ